MKKERMNEWMKTCVIVNTQILFYACFLSFAGVPKEFGTSLILRKQIENIIKVNSARKKFNWIEICKIGKKFNTQKKFPEKKNAEQIYCAKQKRTMHI